MNIKFISPYHHKSNGKTERRNRICRDLLRIIGYDLKIKHYEDLQWNIYLPVISFIINITADPDTKLTPYELRYGTHPPDPTLMKWEKQLNILNDNNKINNEFISIIGKHHKLFKKLNKKAHINITEFTNKRFKKHLKNLVKKKITNVKIGDICKLKNLQYKGNKMKFKAKYSEDHKVIKLNSFKNSVKVVPIKNNLDKNGKIINDSNALWRNINSIKIIKHN